MDVLLYIGVILTAILVVAIMILYLRWTINLAYKTDEYWQDSRFSTLWKILFSILTGGLYTIYWLYKIGKNLNQAGTKRKIMIFDFSIVYVILWILLLGYGEYNIILSLNSGIDATLSLGLIFDLIIKILIQVSLNKLDVKKE